MSWGLYTSLFLLGTIKFMVAPLGGPALGLSFLETYVSCVSGAIFSSSIFFFSASYFMKKSEVKRQKAIEHSRLNNEEYIPKNKFTRMNKLIVKLKRSIGIIGISLWAPLFLSIPLGSIVVAKFYGKNVITYPLIILGILINGVIITGITYLIV